MHRKKPFSSKQKKKQLQEKRDRKREQEEDYEVGSHHQQQTDVTLDSDEDGKSHTNIEKLNQQPKQKTDKTYDPNRYKLHFMQESREEIEKRKIISQQPLQILPETALEVDLDDVYQPGSVLDMPKRPPWKYTSSKQQLQANEEKYFREYLENITEKYSSEELSYLEFNLETWRQLWRVLEMADIVLLITDIRHPALHFSPTLYDYVTTELKKHIILVLNKTDLAPAALVTAWKHYFQEKFPKVHIVCFTSFPKDQQDVDDPGKILHKKRRKRHSAAGGQKQLLKACEGIVQGKVNLTTWAEKIEVYMNNDSDGEDEVDITVEEGDGCYKEHEEYRDGVLTIGCCGYPNVGKSSLINGLVGNKVVSVSRTPGHTKHFQTIFLTPSVKLCDSPGLVFPSLISKPMQILAGIYPIAQVREPYTAVGYLSQRIPVPKLLKIKHPEREDKEWTAFDICDAWAEKRGYITAKAARTDVYRAANSILRLAVEARLCMCMRPPGYTQHIGKWEEHPDTQEIAVLQQIHQSHYDDKDNDDISTDSESEDEEAQGDKEQNENINEKKENKASIAMSNPFALLMDD